MKQTKKERLAEKNERILQRQKENVTIPTEKLLTKEELDEKIDKVNIQIAAAEKEGHDDRYR